MLNGPNLNLLGTREPDVYGRATLSDIEALCRDAAAGLDVDIVFEQTNHEGVLVDLIQRAGREASAIVINPAAYTHTSIALLDALKGVDVPAVEVHLSQPAAREPFRAASYAALAAAGSIAGFGAMGYALAVEAAARLARARLAERKKGS
ncbi:3-dehydroquinate dehydratase [Alkalicaulis satelles]|uniref:3-dehydroquinate dehydratase n=1 Tax=Alkalicaulis satelles TaxID=2609175 RepID=A0A5M6ZCY5_9PROT|nr:3-dehydroquinate dehydratase [Alkalicaulis satelles]